MKQQVKRLAAVLGLVTLTALAGCGGGSSSSSSTPTSVSGVVADGYLVGAKVCLDKNKNKVCDAGEPYAMTTAGGNYTLSNVSAADVAAYPMLVEVTTTATDEQRGPVTAGYVLTAPAGKPTFISPLTTLVQNQIETTGLSADVAEATVRNSLGLDTSLFSDFKPGAATATTEQKLAASIAKVIATTIASNKANIEGALGAGNVSVDAVVKLVVQQVIQQLPTVLQKVQENLVSGVLTEAAVTNVINNSNVTISTSAPSTLTDQLAAAAVTATTSDLVSVMSIGSYWLERYISGYVNSQYTYNTYYGKNIYTSSNNRVSFSQFMLNSGAWTPSTNSGNIYLTSSGWQTEDGSYGTYNPATSTYTSSGGTESMKVSLVKYDISGKALGSYLLGFQGTAPTGTFAANSEAYRVTFTYAADSYRLDNDFKVCVSSDQSGNCTAYAGSLDVLISSMSYPYGGGVSSNNVGFQFGTYNSTTKSGTLYLYTATNQSAPIATSTYQIRTVNNQQILIADTRPAGGGYAIFAMYNGGVHGGEFHPANVAMMETTYGFNKTAMNSIATAAGLPAIP